MRKKSNKIKGFRVALANAALLLLLSGCADDYFDRAYDGARKAAGMAAGAASEAVDSMDPSSVKDKVSEAAKEAGLMSPDELLDGIMNFGKTPQGASEGSNSAQNGFDGKSADGWQKDDSWGGNSDDRSIYDSAWSAGKDGSILTKVTLCRVVDGDTVVVELEGSYSYVRLIGINTPESVAPDEYLKKTGKENTQEGKDASAHSKELLSGVNCAWLEFDAEEYDPYERLLAYVWLTDDRTDLMNMLNARILADGYAEPMAIRPNVRHAEEFAALVDDGR